MALMVANAHTYNSPDSQVCRSFLTCYRVASTVIRMAGFGLSGGEGGGLGCTAGKGVGMLAYCSSPADIHRPFDAPPSLHIIILCKVRACVPCGPGLS